MTKATDSFLMTDAEIEDFFKILQDLNPQPRGELTYVNPFTLLVSVVLSAQATDKSVNLATPALFAVADTPQKMIALGQEKIQEFIKKIGFSSIKSKYIMTLSHQLIDQYQGEVPQTIEQLMQLSGVGRKTANVVLNIAFQQPTLAVDTHVFRVSNRTGLAPGATPDKVEQNLLKRVPQNFLFNAHHWLILHGRYICKAIKPQCYICPVKKLCHYPSKTLL